VESALAIVCGIGLAASCGFRVFVPLLMISLAAMSGHLKLAESFQWLASWPALVTFAVATLLELIAYYVPWLDNLLDLISLPAAAVAGTVLMAAMVAHLSPFLQWTLAIIAGGGTAASVQGLTMFARTASTSTSGGVTNPVVATIENVSSVIFSWLSILAPMIALVLLAVTIALLVWFVRWLLERRRMPAEMKSPP
jgi:hypothetical protein